MVTSSSRSSSSVMARPSSSRAESSSDRMSVRDGSGAAISRARCARSARSTSSRRRKKVRQGLNGKSPYFKYSGGTKIISDGGGLVNSTSSAASSSICAPSSSPNTARKITCERDRLHVRVNRERRAAGMRSTCAAATSAISAAYDFMRSPCSGGNRRRRWRRCALPSSSSTELRPTTGSSIAFALPACSCSGSPVNTCLISSGAVSMTNEPKPGMRSVNGSP